MKTKIIILGAKGLLGKNLIKTCEEKNFSFVSVGRKECDINLDLTNNSATKKIIDKTCKNIIINATGFTSLDKCEKDYDNCYKINTKIVDNIINTKLKKNFRFVQISTDQLYDGKKGTPNKEDGKIKIINKYAKTKFDAEKISLSKQDSLVIRTNFTGLKNNNNETFYEWALHSIKNNRHVNLFDDMYNSTIDVKSASNFILDLALSDAKGIFNLGSADFISKKDFVLTLASELKVNFTNFKISSVENVSPKRCKYLGLDVSKISKYLKTDMPTSKEVIKNLVSRSEF